MQDILIRIILSMLPMIIDQLSPVIKALVKDSIIQLYEKSKMTDNPWDDVLAKALMAIFEIPVPA